MSKILPDGVYIVRDKRLYKVDFYEPIFENCKTVKVEIPNFEVLPMTNADRIRAMSDEELAQFIWNRDIDIVEKSAVAGHFTFTVDREECFKNVLDWLKKEAEE